ncbi:hypothetical protein SEUCBS140593_006522 [Sporothrix eucalyptigena]|uniref:Uncharacterized protein n=1 Tax=Sporothrix eucalyptigena TaxID=1812306 RepID=A0ABP0C5I8_9PEZI
MSLWERIDSALVVSHAPNRLDNHELRAIPVRDRQWGTAAYGVFWMGAISAAGAWIATPLTSGLGVWSGVFAMFGGMILSSIGLAVNSRAGAVYRIPYPVFCRSCFGVYGAYWPVFCRLLVTLAFAAIGVATAAQLLSVMFTCISPNWEKIPNHMGVDSILTSGDMISFLIFWLVLCLFSAVPVPRWRFFVYIKIVIYWAATLGLLGWVLHQTGGAGPILSYPASVTGSKYAWTMVQFVFYFLNQSSSYISNAADFSRYATKPRDPLVGHLITFPIANLVNTIVGFIILGSSVPLFGEAQWNPVSAWILQPWYLLGSASVFISFISGFSTFLSAIIGVQLAQYYVIARGHLDMEALFSADPGGPYYFWRGVNWRAFAAYVLGVAPNFYGFLGQMGVSVPTSVTHLQYFSCILGIGVSFIFFLAFTFLFPPKNGLPRPAKWMEPEDFIDPTDPWLCQDPSERASVQNELSGVQGVGTDGRLFTESKTLK